MKKKKFGKSYRQIVFPVSAIVVIIFLLPIIFIYGLKSQDKEINYAAEFPVTVDPTTKTIIEDAEVNDYLQTETPLQATALLSFSSLRNLFTNISIAFSRMPIYKNLALAGGQRIVVVNPGMRKEEVASIFGKSLGWTEADKKSFLTKSAQSNLPLVEGSYYPGAYVVEKGMTTGAVQDLVNKRFISNIISRYSETTESKIPLNTTLTIASLIQRETIGTDDMRLVSGIIWNRVFRGMNLQLDATLQYAKASTMRSSVWWPEVYPADKFIKSPYNTYQNKGLPPAPIANPSLAAVLAALNPVKTDCLYYFHDEKGEMHCTPDYQDHVALLKKYYGRGR